MQILFEKVLARDRFVNIGILPSVNSAKQKRVAKQETSVCSRIIRLMNNQTKKPKKGYYSPKKRKRCVAIVKIVPQLRCVSQDSEALVSRRGIQSRVSLRYVKYPGKYWTIAWKVQVKNLHQRSPNALKFEDQSHEETERQQRCARSKAWNLAKNIYKLKEKGKASFYCPAEEWVLPAASTKEREEREFVVDSRASMHKVSKKDLSSAELVRRR